MIFNLLPAQLFFRIWGSSGISLKKWVEIGLFLPIAGCLAKPIDFFPTLVFAVTIVTKYPSYYKKIKKINSYRLLQTHSADLNLLRPSNKPLQTVTAPVTEFVTLQHFSNQLITGIVTLGARKTGG